MPIQLDSEATTTSPMGRCETVLLIDRSTSRDVHELAAPFQHLVHQYLRESLARHEAESALVSELGKLWTIRGLLPTVACLRKTSATYDWRKRLVALRDWKGDPSELEASSLTEAALQFAEKLASYAEARQLQLFGSLLIHPVMSPLSTGGVHLEFNVRTGVVHHLEIEILPSAEPPYPILRTIERKNGEIREARELPQATAIDLWASIDAFIVSSGRLA